MCLSSWPIKNIFCTICAYHYSFSEREEIQLDAQSDPSNSILYLLSQKLYQRLFSVSFPKPNGSSQSQTHYFTNIFAHLFQTITPSRARNHTKIVGMFQTPIPCGLCSIGKRVKLHWTIEGMNGLFIWLVTNADKNILELLKKFRIPNHLLWCKYRKRRESAKIFKQTYKRKHQKISHPKSHVL